MITLEELFKILDQYDEKYGKWPESDYEGAAIKRDVIEYLEKRKPRRIKWRI